ncbi:MAG: xanthan lyase [Bacteroidaceae bacterium]|nr:xanthan lyase [Bacteroidaceae bacterium]
MFRCVALLTAVAVLLSVVSLSAQTDNAAIRASVTQHFEQYQSDVDLKNLKVERTDINRRGRRLDVRLNQNFGYQLFRHDLVDSIYSDLRKSLPEDVSSYHIQIYAGSKTIESLIPNWARNTISQKNLWNETWYDGRPWVNNESRIYTPKKGLTNIHMAVTPSHGLYFDNEDSLWEWQRPPLYCTHEDLLTQSFAYPYIIPMLENAGAVVYTARERDWQTNGVIVKCRESGYREDGSWSEHIAGGFSQNSVRILPDTLQVETRTTQAGNGPGIPISTAFWIPDIPEDGDYGVYVTYQTDSSSIDDARYIVFHTGGSTTFRVNQQMGGGTWVYLGTFHFRKGESPQGMVSLDNSSEMHGTVNADAVRFGGGTHTEISHQLEITAPRYNMGARYYTRFAGAPDSVYSKYQGADEYREDIWTRPYMANWLSGGSVFNKANPGLGVPLELYFALHTDAGYTYGDTLFGSLGICTTDFNDGLLGEGHTRDISRDLTDMVLSELNRDLPPIIGREWAYRGIWDKNYCESREPQVLSMLLELLSHQNFRDVCLALNPNFRFMASRSIYKAILKYVSFLHDRSYVVQPLPVDHLSIRTVGNTFSLSWQAVTDTLEPTATPRGYIVYTAIDDNGFDGGTFTRVNRYRFVPQRDHMYRFKVTAVNEGGQSMPSETLAAYMASESKGTVLVVNGFQRLSGPETVITDSTQGFDILADPGVQYMRSPILSGAQQIFALDSIDSEEEVSLGIGDDRLNGALLAGNTFDYPAVHGRSIAQAGWSFVSCSREAVQEGMVNLTDYAIVDLILGLQKRSAQDSICNKDYSTFPSAMQKAVRNYLQKGGKLLCSGSYVGADMISELKDESFASEVLHYRWEGPLPSNTERQVKGMRSKADIRRIADKHGYGVTKPDVIKPVGLASTLFTYSDSRLPAGVGYKDRTYATLTLGFPFESIESSKERDRIMKSAITYLTE